MMKTDHESHVDEAAARHIPDARVKSFWDGEKLLVGEFSQVLEFEKAPAWDLYMIYGPDTRWEGSMPPRPAYWMHQLGSKSRPKVRGPWLDGTVFGGQVRVALGVANRR